MKRGIPTIAAVVLFGALCWAFPPFHIRSLSAVRKAQAGSQFNPSGFAAQFWVEKLLPAAQNAADAAAVLAAASAKPESVREEFGRAVGVGSSYYLFIRGSGRIVHVDEYSIGLSLQPEVAESQIVIETGFVFGNAVRDGTGLLDSSRYPNAQEFNDISAALNSIVETNVIPKITEMAQLGRRFQFAGCAEVRDEEHDLKPLKLVPISVKPIEP